MTTRAPDRSGAAGGGSASESRAHLRLANWRERTYGIEPVPGGSGSVNPSAKGDRRQKGRDRAAPPPAGPTAGT